MSERQRQPVFLVVLCASTACGSPASIVGSEAVPTSSWEPDTAQDTAEDMADRTGGAIAWSGAAGLFPSSRDLNGDGYDDLVAGAEWESDAASWQGAVNVLFGGSAGLSSTADQYWTQDSSGVLGTGGSNEMFGHAVTTGDLNGDGYAELIVGVTNDSGSGLCGSVHVLPGSSGGPTSTGDQQWSLDTSGVEGSCSSASDFGAEVEVADFNDDGFDDLAVGVTGMDVSGTANAGAVNILYGSTSGLTSTGDQQFSQDTTDVEGVAESNDYLGRALAAGDFNCDRISDLAIGVPYEDIEDQTDAGAVNVLYGSTAGLSATGDAVLYQGYSGLVGTSSSGDKFGSDIAAGDFDGDGCVDLAIGVPEEDASSTVTDSGAVVVIHGSSSGLSTSEDAVWTQDTSGVEDSAEVLDKLGWSVASGDFNGDGYDDLAIGVVREDVGAVGDAGMVNVLYGGASGLSSTGDQAWSQDSSGVEDSAEVSDKFGIEVSTADFNGDGYDDLAIGVALENVGAATDAGAVNILYGSSAGLSSTGDQLWTQDTSGVDGTAETNDNLGIAMP